MLAAQRQKLIVDEIRREGGVRVSELTGLLGVSEMTIRRDIDVLAAAGPRREGARRRDAARRPERGGAGLRGEVAPAARARRRRSRARPAGSSSPARRSASRAGTTTWRLAHHLADIPDLTVVTNSIQVADVLHRAARPDLTVVLTGGVRTPSDALVGPIAVSAMRSLHLDVLFLGVHGITADAGLTTPNLLEAETDRALVAASERLVVVADHVKWGVRGLSRIAGLEDVDVFVSDPGLSAQARATIKEHVDRLVIAPKGTGAAARRGAA